MLKKCATDVQTWNASVQWQMSANVKTLKVWNVWYSLYVNGRNGHWYYEGKGLNSQYWLEMDSYGWRPKTLEYEAKVWNTS